MLEGIISLASYGFFAGGSIGNVLAQWQALGIFDYVLPFLLIFALIFVMLGNVSIFKENKAVNAVIALSVSLMALQFDFVSRFFAEIFPRVGVALSVLLVVIIFLGLFIKPEQKGFKWLFVVIGLIITAVVVFSSLSSFAWSGGGYFWRNNWGNIILVALIVGAFIAVIATQSPQKKVGKIQVPLVDD